jgi:hypothetical protein
MHHRTPSVRIARLFAPDYGEYLRLRNKGVRGEGAAALAQTRLEPPYFAASFKISNLALYYSESASHSSRTGGLGSLSARF